jgi:hypothetical protein
MADGFVPVERLTEVRGGAGVRLVRAAEDVCVRNQTEYTRQSR